MTPPDIVPPGGLGGLIPNNEPKLTPKYEGSKEDEAAGDGKGESRPLTRLDTAPCADSRLDTGNCIDSLLDDRSPAEEGN